MQCWFNFSWDPRVWILFLPTKVHQILSKQKARKCKHSTKEMSDILPRRRPYHFVAWFAVILSPLHDGKVHLNCFHGTCHLKLRRCFETDEEGQLNSESQILTISRDKLPNNISATWRILLELDLRHNCLIFKYRPAFHTDSYSTWRVCIYVCTSTLTDHTRHGDKCSRDW